MVVLGIKLEENEKAQELMEQLQKLGAKVYETPLAAFAEAEAINRLNILGYEDGKILGYNGDYEVVKEAVMKAINEYLEKDEDAFNYDKLDNITCNVVEELRK